MTALILDAYNSLGEAAETAEAAVDRADLIGRFEACCHAVRRWALANPHEFALTYGTPIPGYEAPADITLPAAAWALVPLIETLQALYEGNKLRMERLAKLTPTLRSMLGEWQEFVKASGLEAHIEVLYLAFVIWSRVHGLVTLELGHQTPSFITDPGEIFRRELDTIQKQYLSWEAK